MGKKQKKYIIFEITIAAFFLIIIGNASLISPFFGDINFIDEGQFGAWANHMLLGKQMYKDIYITYGPLYVYPLYLLFKIFSPSAFLVRLYLTMGGITGISVVDLFLHKIQISKYSRWLIIFFMCVLPVMQLRQAAGFLVILLALKNFESKNIIWSFLTGFSVMLAFLISPEIGIFSSILVSIMFVYKFISERTLSLIFSKAFFVFLGCTICSYLFYIWSSSEGWFKDYVNVTQNVLFSFSGINLPNGQNFPNPFMLAPFGKGIFSWIKFVFSKEMLLYWLNFGYVLTLFYFFVKFCARILNKNDKKIIIITLYGLLLYIILVGRSGIGHFFFILSPFLIISGFFIEKLFRLLFEKKEKKIGKFASLILILLIFIFLTRIVLIFRPYFANVTVIPRTLIINKNNPKYIGNIYISDKQKEHIWTIQNFVAKNVSQKDNIFFFNDEPMMYLLINKVNPARYDLPFIANTKDKRLEILNSFINKPPKYIIEDKDVWSVDGIGSAIRLPEVFYFINANYVKSTLTKGIIVYKLKKI